MKYYEEHVGYVEDGLIAGEHVGAIVHNVSIAANASISRGELLCEANGVWSPAMVEADASKPLAIAYGSCTADSVGAVTQAYMAGVFNADKVIVGGADSLTAEAFREALRKDNIHLTGGDR